jgi:hypothetical protein
MPSQSGKFTDEEIELEIERERQEFNKRRSIENKQRAINRELHLISCERARIKREIAEDQERRGLRGDFRKVNWSGKRAA